MVNTIINGYNRDGIIKYYLIKQASGGWVGWAWPLLIRVIVSLSSWEFIRSVVRILFQALTGRAVELVT